MRQRFFFYFICLGILKLQIYFKLLQGFQVLKIAKNQWNPAFISLKKKGLKILIKNFGVTKV